MLDTTEVVDLSGAMPEETAVLEIMTADGRATGWRLTMAGPAHPKAVAYADELSRRELRKQAALEAQQFNRRRVKVDTPEVGDRRRENVEWAVSRIIAWTPVRVGGEVYAFSDATAIALLMRPDMGWALGQIIEYLADDRSFTKGSASS